MTDPDHSTNRLLVTAALVVVLAALTVGVFDVRDPCRGIYIDLTACSLVIVEQSAGTDPAAGLSPAPVDDWEYLRREFRDLADYLDLQTDAEYCAEFPEDGFCNGTDP